MELKYTGLETLSISLRLGLIMDSEHFTGSSLDRWEQTDGQSVSILELRFKPGPGVCNAAQLSPSGIRQVTGLTVLPLTLRCRFQLGNQVLGFFDTCFVFLVSLLSLLYCCREPDTLLSWMYGCS